MFAVCFKGVRLEVSFTMAKRDYKAFLEKWQHKEGMVRVLLAKM
jgi:hypothetical protein